MEAVKESKGSEFHVLLSGLKLPDALEKRLSADIQRVVASALAGYPGPDGPDDDGPAGGGHGPIIGPRGGLLTPHIVIPPRRWNGYLLRVVGQDFKINPAEVNGLEQQLQRGILGR